MKDHSPWIKELIDVFKEYGSSGSTIQEIPDEHIFKYRIVKAKECGKNLLITEEKVKKPRPKDVPSHLDSFGRCLFTPALLSFLKRTSNSDGGEIQLTNAKRLLVKKGRYVCHCNQGKR